MTAESKRQLVKPLDIILIIAVAAVCTVLFFAGKGGGERTAVIYVDGEVVREIELNRAPDETFTLDTKPVVTLKVENGCIYFTDAKCPDRTCEKSGKLKNSGDTAACLPAKTVVTVKSRYAEKGGADAVAF